MGAWHSLPEHREWLPLTKGKVREGPGGLCGHGRGGNSGRPGAAGGGTEGDDAAKPGGGAENPITAPASPSTPNPPPLLPGAVPGAAAPVIPNGPALSGGNRQGTVVS